MVFQPEHKTGPMPIKKKTNVVVENGQERDLADSREGTERGRELRKLAKDCL
jgi:hypothetical protein